MQGYISKYNARTSRRPDTTLTVCVGDALQASFRFHRNVVVRVALAAEPGDGVPKSLPFSDPHNGVWVKRFQQWTSPSLSSR